MSTKKESACQFELSVRTFVQIEQALLRIIKTYILHYLNISFVVAENDMQSRGGEQ